MNPRLLTVAIDPGKHGCGVAEFIGTELVKACYLKNGDGEGWFLRPGGTAAGADFDSDLVNAVAFILEKPQIYRTRKMKGDQNDLVDISVAGGFLLGQLHVQATGIVGSDRVTVEKITPSVWKKQLKKEIAHERINKKLTAQEKSAFNKTEESLMHNVWDAVGIGLWGVGRYKP